MTFRTPLAALSTLVLILAVDVLLSASSSAAEDLPKGSFAFSNRFYSAQTVQIEMRDGVQLHTEIRRPRAQMGPLPFFVIRTPYGADSVGYGDLETRLKLLAEEGYIFVFQETRGTGQSEGDFELNAPFRSKTDPQAIDEATDAFDTFNWLTKSVPDNNGKVGVAGCSYPGYAAVLSALSKHPAVSAVSPQAAMSDLFRGDDFFWNGIPIAAQTPFFIPYMENNTEIDAQFDSSDAYEWHLQAGALKDKQPKTFRQPSPIWSELIKTDRLSPYWEQRVLADHADSIEVPTLHVMGWFDAEDFPGPIRLFQAADKLDTSGNQRVIIGPWTHCMWFQPGPGDEIGPYKHGVATIDQFKQTEARFFAYHLKNKGDLNDMPQAQIFETGEGGGWRSLETFPSKDVSQRSFYLGARRQLLNEPGSEGVDQYISDPLNPIPYTPRPIDFFHGETLVPGDGKARALFLLEDQRFVHGRPDMLIWMSAPLEDDVIIDGQAMLELTAATTGTNVDWIVQLVDVYPDTFDQERSGYRVPVTRGALRASLRKDPRKPEPTLAGEPEEYKIPLEARRHRFSKGHRILVSLQSTFFPYLARNPQQFIAPDQATNEDFRVVTNTVERGGLSSPSRIILPIANP
ncbi:MAG: CocE/NonD family hydrolase [Pseudomonadota bacterium]